MPIFDPRIFDSGVFDTGGTVTPVDRTITIDGALPQLGGSVQLVQGQGTTIAGALPGMSGVVNVLYVSGAARPIVGVAEQRWQQALRMEDGIAARWQDSHRTNAGTTDRYADAETLQAGVATGWQDSVRLPTANEIRYQRGIRVPSASATGRWQQGIPVPVDRTVRFQDVIKTPGRELGFRFQQGIGMRHSKASRFQQAIPLEARQVTDQFDNSIRSALLLASRYQDALGLLAGISEHPVVDPTDPTDPDPHEPIIVPIRKVYMVQNHIALERVDTGDQLEADAFSMSLSSDSWTWSWSASLSAMALAIITPELGEDPIELSATVNGISYRLTAENYSRDRTFASTRVRVQGRGRAAILDAPYAPILNHASADPLTAQQLMALSLSINGVSIGWDLDFRIADWLVPGGTWSLQGSYIAAVIDIARAAGAYVQPHRTDATLRILPRYPSVPASWGDLTPDFEIPADVASIEGIEWKSLPDYNRIFVSGTTSGGVLGQVTRTGTDGSAIAPMVTHSLIVDAIAARQRGLAELSNTGRQALVSLRMPVLAETGIIHPGAMVRYVDGPTTRLGIVRSTALSWARPVLRQTIGIETHES